MAKPKLKDAIAAVTKTRGTISAAARVLGCSRQTLYNMMERHKELREAVEDARAYTLDRAELKLLEAIEQGEAWAITLYLKTQGRTRGYSEKHEVIQTTRNTPAIDPSKLSDRELEQLERLLAKAGAGGEVPA